MLKADSGLQGIWAVNQARSNPRKPNMLDRILGLYGADPNTHIPEDQRRTALRQGLRQGAMSVAGIAGRGHDAPTLGQNLAAFAGGMQQGGQQVAGQIAHADRQKQMMSMLGDGTLDANKLQAIMMRLIAEGTPEAMAQAQMIGTMIDSMSKMGQGQFTLGDDEVRFDAFGNVVADRSRNADGSLALDTMPKIDTGEYVQFIHPDTGEVVRSYQKGSSSDLRGDFRNDTKDFQVVAEGVQTIESAFADPSAAGDLAGIFAFMKVLDPGSVVRESEFANAQNAAGVPERVRALYNRVLAGERLSEETRRDFLGRARRIAAGRQEQLRGIIDRYNGIAERVGVDPRNVTYDYFGNFEWLKGMEPGTVNPPQNPTPPGGLAPGQEGPVAPTAADSALAELEADLGPWEGGG